MFPHKLIVYSITPLRNIISNIDIFRLAHPTPQLFIDVCRCTSRQWSKYLM